MSHTGPRPVAKSKRTLEGRSTKNKEVTPMMFYSALLAEGINELLAATLTQEILLQYPENELDISGCSRFHHITKGYGYIAPGDHFHLICTLNWLISSSHMWTDELDYFWQWLVVDLTDNHPEVNNFKLTGKPVVKHHSV